MAKSPIITGLDIGSNTIKLLVVQKNSKKSKSEENGIYANKETGFEVLAMTEENSLGVRKGVVINPNDVSEILKQIIKKTEEQINKKIDSVYVNIGGSHIFSTTSKGLVSTSRADQKISPEDIERVLQAAQTISLPSNREILDVFPREFIIDGEKGIKEPLGLSGLRLEAEVLVLAGFSPYIKNLTTAILNAGLQINDLFFSPIAAAQAVLTSKEKELGVCLLDIGAGTTNLAVFEDGELSHVAVLPIGSSHITNDIAIFLKSDVDTAERIKLEFGCLFPKNEKREKIKISEEEVLIFSQKQLAKIITVRILEIFQEANKELKKISKQNSLPAGIVLTGGGAKLSRIKELAKKEFRLPTRIGKLKNFPSFSDDPRLAVVCGLVLMGSDLEEEENTALYKKGIGEKIKKIFKIFIP